MAWHEYQVRLRHDAGQVTVTTVAESEAAAIRIVLAAELAVENACTRVGMGAELPTTS